MFRPLVSVIVPAYNRERYLAGALDSIFMQDYRPIEVIVVDDGSTDGTARVAESYAEVCCLCQPHRGVSAARNLGIAASRGEFLAFLDSDDRWVIAEKLSLQVDYLLQHPAIGYCMGKMQNVLEAGIAMPDWITPKELLPHDGISPCTMLIRREAFARVGPFDTRFSHGEDTDWLFRAKEAGLVYTILPELIVHRRIHKTNLMHTRGPQLALMAKLLQASMARRRGQNLAKALTGAER